MFDFLKKPLSIFTKLSKKIRSLLSGSLDDTAFDNLEQLFYEADLGASVAAELTDKVRALYKKNSNLSTEEILSFLKKELLALFPPTPPKKLHTPHIILIVGVNGSGKTTSLAKLASTYQSKGKKVLISAGDTFRAAASDQLETWAKR